MLTNVFRGRIFWLGREPLTPGARYKMKLCTGEYPVEVEKIEKVIDVNDLATSEPNYVERNAIAEVVLRRGERWRSIRSTTTCSPAGSSRRGLRHRRRRPHQYGRPPTSAGRRSSRPTSSSSNTACRSKSAGRPTAIGAGFVDDRPVRRR